MKPKSIRQAIMSEGLLTAIFTGCGDAGALAPVIFQNVTPEAVGWSSAALAGAERIAGLRDRLEEGIRRLVPAAAQNGDPKHRLPNTLNLTLPGLRGESLVVALDQHGIALSSGSACKTGSPDPTHVLIAMGRSEVDAHCAIRISLSHETTDEHVDRTIAALAEVLEEMETTVRFLSCK